MNISLKQLQVFRAVAAERNFSRAGELVGLTQPAVSRAITELEKQVNLRLLDRIQQNVLSSIVLSEVDFGIIVEPDPAIIRELHCETLLLDPFVVVCPPDHPLFRASMSSGPQSTRQPTQWRDLNGEKLILLDQASGSRRLIDSLLTELDITHQVIQQVGHVTTGFEMVRAGSPKEQNAGATGRSLMDDGQSQHRRNRNTARLAKPRRCGLHHENPSLNTIFR